jgi:hypothetical protein
VEEFMLNLKKTSVAWALAIAAATGVGSAQTPAPAAASATPTPMYYAFPLEIVVNKPAAEVWARVGKYCDIQEWLGLTCTLSSGKEGEAGAVRSLNNGAIQEIIVGKSAMSYTYAQPARPGRPYDMYHGTLEAQALTPTTTKLMYTVVVDEGVQADDAAREADKARRATQFKSALENMKILAEGGTLPPRQGRGGRGGGRGRGQQ